MHHLASYISFQVFRLGLAGKFSEEASSAGEDIF